MRATISPSKVTCKAGANLLNCELAFSMVILIMRQGLRSINYVHTYTPGTWNSSVIKSRNIRILFPYLTFYVILKPKLAKFVAQLVC